jgi:hypothetical protein
MGDVFEAKPRLAVFYDALSPVAFTLAEAAAGLCELVWVVDDKHPIGIIRRLLGRLGVVFDATDLSPDDIAARFRELGVNGVFAASDALLEDAADAALAAELAFHTPDVAHTLSDKFAQREALRRGGVPVPSYLRVTAHSGARVIAEVIQTIALPVVVKPTRSTGSRETRMVRNHHDLVAALNPDSDEDVIIEGFLDDASPEVLSGARSHPGAARAPFVSVETMVQNGDPQHLFITGRFPLAEPLRETGSFLPSDLPETQAGPVREAATAAARALRIQTGFLHIEVKLTPDGPRIIEVNARVGGGIAQLVKSTGGPDLLRWSMKLALGDKINEVPPARVGVGYFMWEQPPRDATRVVGLSGFTDVPAIPGVLDFIAKRASGDPVDWREGGGAHVYQLEGVAPDHATLWARRQQILNTAIVTYDAT